MRETMEFRIPEANAEKYLASSIGDSRGTLVRSVRRVCVRTDDALFRKICDLDLVFQNESNGKNFFFLGWSIHREYSRKELSAAEAFQLVVRRTFDPAGEECGTIYDESIACAICGSGAAQISNLMLETHSLPRSARLAIARTIAGEIIVSDRFVDLQTTHGIKGATFRPVLRQGEQRTTVQDWHQLYETSSAVNIVAPTKAGIRPTNEDAEGRFRCPLGHTIGLNLLSELSVSRSEFENAECDIAFTKQRVGTRRGLLRPEAKIVISPRMRRAIIDKNLRGFKFEVVHLGEKGGGTVNP